MSAASLAAAIAQVRRGGMVVMTDDEDREDEGDLVCAAEFATPANIAFMARQGSGLICLPMEAAWIDRLGLPQMTPDNRTPRRTAFTVSIEARDGIGTGISAFDRARTVAAAIAPDTRPEHLISPGHMFPLRAAEGGVLERAGHTEGSVELMRMAGLRPAAVICEVMADDGHMMRRPGLELLAARHDLPIITVQDIIAARREALGERDAPVTALPMDDLPMDDAPLVHRVGEARLPSAFGTDAEAPFTVHAFREVASGLEHLALVHGSAQAAARAGRPALVRLHCECLTGDALGSLRCDCGPQLRSALAQAADAPFGVVLYLRGQEGRGIGLANKIRAYALQDRGLDTIEANTSLGLPVDARDYRVAAPMLRALGAQRLEVMTNNPDKLAALRAAGFEVAGRRPLEVGAGRHNHAYLHTKHTRMGHFMDQTDPEHPAAAGLDRFDREPIA